VYVFITKEEGVVEFDYKFFYPFNFGKKACIGARIGRKCIGKTKRFGNHIGDWENVKIRFEDGELHSMYVSTHDSKITKRYLGTFTWNAKRRYFEKGKDGDIQVKVLIWCRNGRKRIRVIRCTLSLTLSDFKQLKLRVAR